MKSLPLLLAALLCISPAMAGEKRVLRIDSLTASQKGGMIEVQAKGAVASGGWSKPRLHSLHQDGRVLTIEFLAMAPPTEMTVIDALVPVTVIAHFKGRAGSVHLLADQNEVTSEVLR
jgi:hypothetical protein